MKKLLLALLLLPALLFGQGNTLTLTGAGAPSGSCAFILQWIDSATGNTYNCGVGGAWQLIAGGGGAVGMQIGGTVTSGTAGSLLFVTAGPVLGQDNANLSYVNADNTLLVGAAVATSATTPVANFGTNLGNSGLVTITAVDQGENLGVGLYVEARESNTAAGSMQAAQARVIGTNTSGNVNLTGFVVNAIGTSDAGGDNDEVVGATFQASAGADTNNAYAIKVLTPGDVAPPTNRYGLYIEDQTGTAIKTGTGITELGGELDITGAAGVRLTGADGILTLLGRGNGNDENLLVDFDNATANTIGVSSGTSANQLTFTGIELNTSTSVDAALYQTATNCIDSAGDAACSAAPAGSVVIDAAATTVVVSTTAVTANSQIIVVEDSSLGTRLSVTCNTTIARLYVVTARTAATSFTVTTSAAPVTNPACLSYWIIN